MRSLILSILLVSSLQAISQSIVDLYIVEGKITYSNPFVPYFTFSESPEFDSSNAVLRFQPGETVTFRVHNRVDFTCAFRIQGHGQIDRIAMDETGELTVTLDQPGTWLYEDPLNDHRVLGLGGMLVVSDFQGPEFYGVFTEHCDDWIHPIADGGPYDKRVYRPVAFTINGRSFPDTMEDSLSLIRGNVGDTIRIHMTNAGRIYHFPHFHGYHVRILNATQHVEYIGRMKDSFGMAPGESMTLELVPDKPGRYPMHNHNLVTTTIGGNYPGGMMMHIYIDE